MDLKYKPAIGTVMLLIGLANFVLAAAAGRNLGMLSGAVFTLLGILMLTKSPVGLSPKSIAMRNLVGMELKRHHLTPGNFEVRNNKIYVDGKKRVSLWMFDADEQAVRDFLNRPN